ncbi:purple acid phosphatase family protein [Dyadobacter pollutisoli]|uniref:Metallophosphoesterase family protein n=1 Tax=Dyadobacter pollutisoli TaxID=2910158 RepID=A0A9E8ND92_9BACT|nr:metallophosphoesterase family protein [Dyadobacter pollutisoli]WAC14540.1 metallophosphoesterase family protein [Dyadobacter pollutisoli]
MKIFLLSLFLLLNFNGLAQTLIRGPYLQSATSTTMVIRWRTDQPTNSRVKYGLSLDAINEVIDNNASETEHEIKLTGLKPKTKYFYSIGSSTTVYQGDPENYFETAPVPGATGKYRFGVLGDCGTNSAIQGTVRDKVAAYLGSNYMNAWLLLGDNAYPFGRDAEYQSGFFNHYKEGFLKRNPLFPSPGNHDYDNDNFDRQNDHNVAYYKIFTMPTMGEAGGVPSETEAFYSWDYGNVHFLSLDSYGREDNSTRLYDTLGRQVEWIKKDLAANKNKDWVVAYWHHPPYTKGSHNSDTDPESMKVRENFIRILERYGVDLILCGHSHDYERSRLIQGHYGKSDTFNPAVHNVSSSSGKYDGSAESCPYIKKSATNNGTVYVVAGSAGQLGHTTDGFPHKAMYHSDAERGGGLILEVEGNRLDAKWIGVDGIIHDQFTIEKDVNKESSFEIVAGKSVELKASFIGKYVWNTGATTSAITVSPKDDTDFTVKDSENCVNDVFHVKVTHPQPIKLIAFSTAADADNLVTIKWISEFENEFSHFIIQRSTNAVDYQEIGQVKGGPNSTQVKNYEYIDQESPDLDVKADYYYRLKMVALDGRIEYSAIRAIKLREIILGNDPTILQSDIQIVPNPSSASQMQIKTADKVSLRAELTLIDISGRTHSTQKLTIEETPKPFLPGKMASGVYFLKVVVNGGVVVKKLVLN